MFRARAEPHGKVQAYLLDGIIKDYCNKYIPHTVFHKLYNRNVMRKLVGDTLLKYGFRSTSVGQSRTMIGLRLKHPPEGVAASMPESCPLPPLPATVVKSNIPATPSTADVDTNVVHLGNV